MPVLAIALGVEALAIVRMVSKAPLASSKLLLVNAAALRDQFFTDLLIFSIFLHGDITMYSSSNQQLVVAADARVL